jgi:hypothetical protein
MVQAVHAEHRAEIQAAVNSEIRRDLGVDVQVDDFVVTKGSVELLFVLTTSYAVIKNFNEYVETLAKAAENVRRLVHGVLRRLPPPNMQLRSWSDYEIGAGVERSRRQLTSGDGGGGPSGSYGPGLRGPLGAPSASALMLFVLAFNSLLVVALLVVVLVRT